MTVQTSTNVAAFVGNGVATSFPIGFKFNSSADLIVEATNTVTGVTTPLSLNSDYTVTGAGDENGGTITFTAAPLAVEKVKVTRHVDLLQLTDLRNQGKFYAEVHEDVFDKLIMIDQQQQTEINAANDKSDEALSAANAANEKSDQAVAKADQNLVDMQAQYDAFEQGASLVVIGDYAAGLVVDGYNKVFRKDGEFYRAAASLDLPYTLTGDWASESANFVSVGDAVLRQELASMGGASLVGGAGQMAVSVSALRGLSKTSASKNAFVTGYYLQGDGGGGAYYLDAADTTAVDNGGTVIVASDGGRWKLSHRGSVSVAQFGSIGDDSTINTDALNRAFAWAEATGGELFVDGIHRTAGGHTITAGKVVSIRGSGPASAVLKSTSDADVLTIWGASECSVAKIGFDKVIRDRTGQGLVVQNTAYAIFDHITAYGFLNGIKTEAVLTSLFIKPLCRFNDIGLYLADGPDSNPNAITVLNPSLSLNSRWGLRANKPASLMVIGGSIEGNGWDATTFHGGAYISNAGGEGGVGATFDGVHMEQNHGDADIHIAQTTNAGTVFNILNCPIFPIDNTHVTANRVYIEINVAVTLNIRGNNFKHYGSYTPSSARKYIKTEAPTLTSVNTGGDSAQFYSAVETPALASWGPNAIREAMLTARTTVNNSGAASLAGTPYNIASATRTGPGTVYLAFAKQMASTDYQAIPVPLVAAKLAVPLSKTVDGFTVDIRDLSGTSVDSPFDVTVYGGL